MGDDAEDLRKNIKYLMYKVIHIKSLLPGASSSPAKYTRLESELRQCKSDLQNAKQRLAELEGAK